MRRLLATLTLLLGCNSPAYEALTAAQDALTSSGGLPSGEASSTGAPDPTTGDLGSASGAASGASSGVLDSLGGTDTGLETGEPGSSSTGEPPVNAPPQVFQFAVSPDQIFEAGAVQLDLDASDDAVEVDLWYGDTLLATLPISAFPYTFDATSQAVCEGSQTFTVTVRDAEGLTDTSAPASLYCQLPAPGSEVYTRFFPGDTASGGAAVVSLPDGTVIVAGVLDGHLALWRLDPDGDLEPGWPKVLMTPGLAGKESRATAVALDATGAIIVAGTITSGTTTRRFLAKLSSEGVLLWEDPGLKLGEEISGLAVSAGGDIVAAGSVRTSPLDQTPAFDSATWGYPKGYPSQAARWVDVFGQPDTDPQPDEENQFSQGAHAVLALPDGDFVVLGEREYRDEEKFLFIRGMWQRYTSAGVRDGALWTSQGLKLANDAFFAGTVTDAGFVAAGWCRHKPKEALRQVCVQQFDINGALVGFFIEPSSTQAEARAVTQDRERKLLIGGFSTKPGQADAWVFASRGADKPLAWSLTYDGGGWDFATGTACDLWGRCTWTGTTIEDGALVLIVSKHNP